MTQYSPRRPSQNRNRGLSRAEAYRRATKKSRSPEPTPEFQMTGEQKGIFWGFVGASILLSWTVQGFLGLDGFMTSIILTAICAGVGGLISAGVILLTLTPEQKRKYRKRRK